MLFIPYGTRHSPLCSETLNSRWNPTLFFKRKFPIKLGQAEKNLFPLLAPLILASPMTPESPKEKAAWKNYCWCVILSDGLCTTSSDWKSPKSSRLKDQSATASEQKLPTFVCMVPLTNSLHIAVNHRFSVHILDMEEKLKEITFFTQIQKLWEIFAHNTFSKQMLRYLEGYSEELLTPLCIMVV